eukprot:CAMPEP_0182928766 /NCGR_PEP_ID=MMETSP0105_2-20130417/17304_1 /TAXON_ID=81532 ORGANISM="Acanthoeca-like sp., Strain 10tr" /NCGR_SAMPLE_ID=MMETSP0105_2 /ASSEMBLY_ACC=CAM_ASM_000205 /LENGTH=67 /DNA_ID=CAMNT_0025066801 /DNA_START=370 /DNA_END=569 /DNA_ORIENTATION=+
MAGRSGSDWPLATSTQSPDAHREASVCVPASMAWKRSVVPVALVGGAGGSLQSLSGAVLRAPSGVSL